MPDGMVESLSGPGYDLFDFKWKGVSPVSWEFNPTNSGLTSTQVGNALFAAMGTWDTNTPYYSLCQDIRQIQIADMHKME